MSKPATGAHRARKRFGQNFLIDQDIIERIVDSVDPLDAQSVVEIGPGKGALTKPLLARCKQLTVIELDRDLVSLLEQNATRWAQPSNTFDIISADALKFDFAELAAQFGQSLRVVGNLPYNISSPLIFHLLDTAQHIEDMHFMLQREVVERLVARPGSKRYGRLSVMVQWQCETSALFDVPASAFSPQPKVESAIVQLKPRPASSVDRSLSKTLLQVVTAAFTQRRKTLRNSLSNIVGPEQMEKLGIDPKARAEVLDIDDYLQIAKSVAKTTR